VVAFVVRRLLIAIPLLLVSTFVTFLLVALSGDPLTYLKVKQPPVPKPVIQAAAHQLWLDQPLLTRYWHWLTSVVHGNFGPSVQGHMNIGHEITLRAWTSLRLVAVAMIIAALLAVLVGVISAVKQYSLTDYSFTLTGFLFLSLPVFWFAVLLKEAGIWVNNRAGQTIFYTIGSSTPGLSGGTGSHVLDALKHLILPTITLALTSFAAWSRFNRASMLEVLNSDYVRLARAKGLSQRQVMVRHALRTALIPLVTVMALDLAGILSQTIITETVYQWHAMGDFLLTAITSSDVFAVLAWLLVAGGLVIVLNLAADVLYAVLDPRIRYG